MRDLFINTLLAPEVRREGLQNLIDYLTKETDFFVAPASTRFHGAEPGGLLAHSVCVVQWAIRLGTLHTGATSSSVRITMRSVTYTYKGDEEIMGATMAAVMELHHSDSVLALNTPHKPSRPYDPNATEPYGDKALSEPCVKALWGLARQAELYINGKRGQISLFDGAQEDTAESVTTEAADSAGMEDVDNIVPFPPMSGNEIGHSATVWKRQKISAMEWG